MEQSTYQMYHENYFEPIMIALMSQYEMIVQTQNAFIAGDEPVPHIPEGALDEELTRFYSAVKRWEIRWETNENAPVKLEGSFNFVPVEKVLNPAIWDLMPETFPKVKDFTILDYFDPDRAVGLYVNQPEKGLFYFEFDGDPYPLNLDFKGYLEMLKYTKGVMFWQPGATSTVDRTSNRVIEDLSLIFPEVNVADFYALYDSVKLK